MKTTTMFYKKIIQKSSEQLEIVDNCKSGILQTVSENFKLREINYGKF
ncbi:MAG: hypothetical protein PF574_02705 [Candidatus Delongbacteria bacterium]|jgi:hypothetical protein|nr:hypothetical protein [Candidatus Delongbacteria bacterium]